MSEVSREVCEEYLDALVTVELAAKLAQKDGRKVNGAIRATVRPPGRQAVLRQNAWRPGVQACAFRD
ncbi:DUF7740 domain-containing protein [Cronobacter sakazakii]|uniref:DUF7740 domain-containing protein n=1 Tax=Cronobacter sakazakii TaxID=28141 RepID=UPI000CFC9488